ncbi:hypothetical protein [Actinopolyspora halophila]|uniref:hypothetical protein n=1 Tax=Actinopolyspora halophila TaxID=1850 RepID=UPI00036E9B7D|nr:hypothetical protein [Actinopolyspora halophila]
MTETYNIHTGQTDQTEGYASPFERAQRAFEQGTQELERTGHLLSHGDKVNAWFQKAQFEMLAAQHEVLERIEQKMQGAAAAGAVHWGNVTG